MDDHHETTEAIEHICDACGCTVGEERYDVESGIALCEECEEADRDHARRVWALLA